MTAPIALFVYNRPEHAKRAIEALKMNSLAAESELHIFSDGPRNETAAEQVRIVREYIDTVEGFQNVMLIKRENNLGLAESVISGVTELCDRYGRIIVLEDDLVASPHFLSFMNDALDRYGNEERVMQISGYMFPVELHEDTDAVFLPFTTSWGWGTWNRAWKHYDRYMTAYESIRQDRQLRYTFELDGSYGFFDMMRSQRGGKIDTWDIQWYLSVFIRGGLTLHPVKTLIENRGFDEAGTHCKNGSPGEHIDPNFVVRRYPDLDVSEISREEIVRYLRGMKSLRGRIGDRLRRIFFNRSLPKA